MMAVRQALLGLCIAVYCVTWVAGCGDDDSAAKKPTAGTPPSGTCKPGHVAECNDSSCKGDAPATATCGSNKKYGACKCPSKTGAADGGKDGGADAAASRDAGMTTEGGATWPMMGYDDKNNYFNPNEHTLSVDNAKNLEMKWSFTVAGYPPGTPIVAEGKVFVMATGGTYAIDLESGKQVWAKTDLVGTASAAYADGFVYVHTASGANLYKLAAKDGTVVWGPVHDLRSGAVRRYVVADRRGRQGARRPLVRRGRGRAAPRMRWRFRAAASRRSTSDDGKRVWTYWTVPDDKKGMEDGAMVWSTVAVDVEGGAVFAGTGNNYSMTGAELRLRSTPCSWTPARRSGTRRCAPATSGRSHAALSGPDTDFGANPILAEVDGKKIVADGDKGAAFWAFDRETGQMLWSRTDLSTSRDRRTAAC